MPRKNFVLRLDSDLATVKGRLERLQNLIYRGNIKAVKDTAVAGKRIASANVPKKTGETQRFLVSSIVYNPTKQTAVAQLGFKKIPHQERTSKGYHGGQFILPYWMTFSPNAPSFNWRFGRNPRFMIIAQQYMKKKHSEAIRFVVKEAVRNIHSNRYKTKQFSNFNIGTVYKPNAGFAYEEPD